MKRKGVERYEQKLPLFQTKKDKEGGAEKNNFSSPIILEEHFLEFTQSRAFGCEYRVLTTELPGIVVQLRKETVQRKTCGQRKII